MTKMRSLTIEEMGSIYGGAIVVEILNNFGGWEYQVWTNDKGYFYCSFNSRAEAERCAKLYTSWEKHIAGSDEFNLDPNEIQY